MYYFKVNFQDFIYLAGIEVASSVEIMKKNGITHILNCAGDYCPNKFKDVFTYKTYYLKDSKSEVIPFFYFRTSSQFSMIVLSLLRM